MISKNNWPAIVLVCIVVSIIITVGSIIIYNYGFTPANQSEQIEKINSYLTKLIIGYNDYTP